MKIMSDIATRGTQLIFGLGKKIFERQSKGGETEMERGHER